MTQHSQHSEWVLNLIIEIDRDSPGFCGTFFRASAERRQVIAAYLAKRAPAPERAAEVARFLSSADHNSILAEAYGAAPEGLRGALRRSGAIVHEQRFYTVLSKLLSKPRHPQVVKSIQRFASIDLMKLRILNILVALAGICRPNVVEALPDVQSASDLIVSFKLLVEAGADEEELSSSIREVRDAVGLSKTMKRALLKCQAPEHPVAGTDNYRPITTTRELHKVAQRFRNCARNYTLELLDGESGHAFAEARHGKEGAVVHLRKRADGWNIEGIFGRSNFRASDALRDDVHAYLGEHGIRAPQRGRPKSAWDAVRRAASSPSFDFDLE